MKSTIEQITAETLRKILYEESLRLSRQQDAEPLEAGDIAKLEKLAKAYSILAAEQRESLKNGLSDLNDEDLESLAKELGEGPDPASNSSDPQDD